MADNSSDGLNSQDTKPTMQAMQGTSQENLTPSLTEAAVKGMLEDSREPNYYRKLAKIHLYRRRSISLLNGPICPICYKPLNDDADMHEALLTRGDVPKEKQSSIMVNENCVLVHHGECHERAATKEGQFACARHLLIMEGYTPIREWLDQMEDKLKSDAPAQARSRMNAILEQVIAQPVREPDSPTLENVGGYLAIQDAWNAAQLCNQQDHSPL